ncbi:TlpA family protein disulfide reductase [bacterium]|nr:TlpA family protein disulfide reductase [bacterium]
MTKLGKRMLLLALLAAVLCTAQAAWAGSEKYAFRLTEASSDTTLELDQLTEDKPLIFLVWSPECPHCQRHMPYVAALYKKLDLEQVNFVTCSVDAPVREAVEYLESKNLSFPVLDGNKGELGSGFTSQGWPTTFVFAPGGRFVGWCDTSGPNYVTEVLDMLEHARPESTQQ